MSTHRIAAVLALTATFGAATACGRREPPPPVDDTQTTSARVDTNDTNMTTTTTPPEAHTGFTTGQKVVVLAGAAAAYYLYKHHKAGTHATGPDGQYYLSKNGRVYYRDAQHRAHWVTPPSEGVRVPENEAHEYREFQGYDGRRTGRDLTGLGNDE